jgi:hypothetical protein
MRNEPGFLDLRQWIDLLESEGELHRITAPVSWDREIGTVSRKVLERKGPALLFENIRGYENARGRRVFTGGIGTRERLALALGFPKDTNNRAIVQHVMKKNRERIPPVRMATGPVKENIVKGDAIDLLEFPVPKWHYLEGGRYINTYACIVTKDPETRVQNVGIYRGMVGRKNSIPSLLIMGGQHWGQHFAKYADRREKMPVACVIGWDPIMGFLAGSPLPAGVCEFEVLGAYRDSPVPLVRCESVDGGAGERQNRHRGVNRSQSRKLRDRGAVRRVHRLRLRPADAAPDHRGDVHHSSQQPDPGQAPPRNVSCGRLSDWNGRAPRTQGATVVPYWGQTGEQASRQRSTRSFTSMIWRAGALPRSTAIAPDLLLVAPAGHVPYPHRCPTELAHEFR